MTMLGWIANILILIAWILVGKKNRSGWIYSVLGNFLWCVYAIQLDLWSALFMDGFCLVLAAYTWWEWRHA